MSNERKVTFRIKELAEARGWGPTKLQVEANRATEGLDVGYATILALWNNRSKNPNLKVLEAIAKVFNLSSVGDLFERESV